MFVYPFELDLSDVKLQSSSYTSYISLSYLLTFVPHDFSFMTKQSKANTKVEAHFYLHNWKRIKIIL